MEFRGIILYVQQNLIIDNTLILVHTTELFKDKIIIESQTDYPDMDTSRDWRRLDKSGVWSSDL